jgi:hypothetical protein
MEPLSATVAAIVTGFLTKGAAALGQQVGEAAADAARTLAQAVLDRLKADPAEQRTVERYEADPEALEPAVEAAIDDAMAMDPGVSLDEVLRESLASRPGGVFSPTLSAMLLQPGGSSSVGRASAFQLSRCRALCSELGIPRGLTRSIMPSGLSSKSVAFARSSKRGPGAMRAVDGLANQLREGVPFGPDELADRSRLTSATMIWPVSVRERPVVAAFPRDDHR